MIYSHCGRFPSTPARPLVLSGIGVYLSRMSTLAEIESAASRLPVAEQEELLRQVTRRLRTQRAAAGPASRESWMVWLEALRDSIGTGRQTRSSEQILEELREEQSG